MSHKVLNNLYKLPDDPELKALRERTQARVARAKAEMGVRYCLHPENHVKHADDIARERFIGKISDLQNNIPVTAVHKVVA